MLLAVSVDLDEIANYREIHGLGSAVGSDAVYERAIPRLRDWARQHGIALTWFVVGRDLERPENAASVGVLAREGDELACHSYSHHYDLTRRTAPEMRSELDRGVAAIERVSRDRPRGFRAPGYVVTDTLLQLAAEVGFTYDSSVFPCPSYYALKAAAIAVHATRSRESKSIIDTPDVLRSPTRPYRVGRPYWYRGAGIWEIPVQVTRRARLPFIGTTLALAGPAGARLLSQGVVGEPTVNLELHGIDALDQGDGLSDLARFQPDLRIPWPKKLDAIGAAISSLRRHGYRCVRMVDLVPAQ